MCGIAAIIGRTDPAGIFEMTRVQAHRGPDDHGHLFITRNKSQFVRDAGAAAIPSDVLAAFGHLRLSILDCTEAGRQPMASADGRDWISYNGEVYNFVELRRELEGLGHTFRTTGDTEVILAAYRQWGTDCFARFNGMWSLAIWDGAKKRIVISRDRFGVKPLHYARHNGALYLASEIKGIFAGATGLSRKPNRDAVLAYLKFGTVNQTNATFFDAVHSFPPSHYAVIDPARPDVLEPVRFWSYSGGTVKVDEREAADEFARLFESAVTLRMRSDVPVGSCLSGGLDSSAIVSVAADQAGEGFHTFNSRFDDPRFDESSFARLVNERKETTAHYVTPSQDGFLEDLSNLVWHQEEPFTTTSIYAQYCIMREAQRHGVTVILDGQGADEVLCGYRKFTVYYLQQLLRERRLTKLSSELIALARHGDRGLLNLADAQRYLPSLLRSRRPGIERFLSDSMASEYATATSTIAQRGDVADRQKLDLDHYSVPSLLRYEDRNSMAFSIESRVPFLDYRLVDWALQLPAGIKIANGRSKAVMRNAMRGVVPDEVLDRRDKMGFVTPQQVWMGEELGRRVEERLRSADFRLGDWVDAGKIADAVAAYRKGDRSVRDGDIFKLYLLDQWADRFDVAV